MTQFYIYIYRDPSRGNEPIYVGKGCEDRAYKHKYRTDKNEFIHRLAKMKRSGIEPIINVVDMPSEAMALQCEIDTIARFGRKDLGLGQLLNLTDGGDGVSGYRHTPESNLKNANSNKGKKHSLKTRQKMSEAHKGVGKSFEHIQKVSDALKGKLQRRVICPHCGKEGGISPMHRYHFDNCKFKDKQNGTTA